MPFSRENLMRCVTLVFSILFLIGCKPAVEQVEAIAPPVDDPAQLEPQGECLGHFMVGTWEGDIGGFTDTLTINADCTYSRSICNETGLLNLDGVDNPVEGQGGVTFPNYLVETGFTGPTDVDGCPWKEGIQDVTIGGGFIAVDGYGDDVINWNVKEWSMPPGQYAMPVYYTRAGQ